MSAYVFPNVYRSTQAQSVVALLSNVAIIAICAPLASKLASKFGKKELATVSCLFGAASYVVCLILHPENVWVYVIFYVMSFVGLGFFNTIIWAMITDVIDDAEVKNGIREDGTIYAVYSFARKLGQAFSSGMVGGLLSLAGYTAATAFEPAVTESIFRTCFDLHLSTEQKTCGRKLCRIGKTQRRKIRRNKNRSAAVFMMKKS